MGNSADKQNILTIIITVVLTIGGALVYIFFFQDNPNNHLLGDGLTAQDGITGDEFDVFGTAAGDAGFSSAGNRLFSILNEIQSLELKNTFESDSPIFLLEDRTVHIESRDPGRDNPFSFIGSGGFSQN